MPTMCHLLNFAKIRLNILKQVCIWSLWVVNISLFSLFSKKSKKNIGMLLETSHLWNDPFFWIQSAAIWTMLQPLETYQSLWHSFMGPLCNELWSGDSRPRSSSPAHSRVLSRRSLFRVCVLPRRNLAAPQFYLLVVFLLSTLLGNVQIQYQIILVTVRTSFIDRVEELSSLPHFWTVPGELMKPWHAHLQLETLRFQFHFGIALIQI